ncbi:hypothetical protein H6S82_02715 [Planktothrix sp. FACHB-1355]|uniref:Uncharacterized protein n=1 Tax=Aerosakkonema funiforme FACHB-1375 TaxID=2949571 RepID=A0A926VFP9_9CYAN|nr:MULTISPECIES: hypothetical protein [Oscillatoriales]MBD2183049.1 hypothetical protein [Aerosakkonema funiforme FACHB-1375]MBD3557767.1 hypothetical protein [Planktothrix sp. FACHB-1355]
MTEKKDFPASQFQGNHQKIDLNFKRRAIVTQPILSSKILASGDCEIIFPDGQLLNWLPAQAKTSAKSQRSAVTLGADMKVS